MRYRIIFKTIITVSLVIAIIWGVYSFMKPIPFLFFAGLVFILIYFFVLFFQQSQQAGRNDAIYRIARAASVLMLLILFGLSVKVLKDYQKPGGNQPYFTNIDHTAIKNYAVGFSDSIELYTEEPDSNHGIWASTSGSFAISSINKQSAIMKFRSFFSPVFGKKGERNYLLNPIYTQVVANGFSIADSLTSLTWVNVSSKVEKKIPKFSFNLIFRTSDNFLLDADTSVPNAYADTIVFENIKLEKGLDLKNILGKAKLFKNVYTREVLTRWIDRFSKVYLLIGDKVSDHPSLQFFPSYKFLKTCSAFFNGRTLDPVSDSDVQFNLDDQFYVGLENERKSMSIREAPEEELLMSEKVKHILCFEQHFYLPLKAFHEPGESPFIVKLRFLKNNYQQLAFNEIREGFLFHEDSRFNDFTNFDAIIKYHSGHTGSPLAYNIIGLTPDNSVSKNKNLFALNSKNGVLTWYFSIRDFSVNRFDFSHSSLYLAALMFLILVLVILQPGKNIILIETPVLIIIYLMMTYRLILLWRVATFPPLENIGNGEFETLQIYDLTDYAWLPPKSILIVSGILLMIFAYRKWGHHRPEFFKRVKKILGWFKLGKLAIGLAAGVKSAVINILKAIYIFFKKFPGKELSPVFTCFRLKDLTGPVGRHCGLLLIGLACHYSGVEWLLRFGNILIPVTSYFIFSRQVLKDGTRFNYPVKKFMVPAFNQVYQYLIHWVETPVFFISLTTFIYLSLFDTGFSVLFLFFLLFKNIIFSFHRSPSSRPRNLAGRFTKPGAYWFYGIFFLAIYLYATIDKRSFFYLIEAHHRIFLIVVPIVGLISYLLINKPVCKKWALGLCTLTFILLLIPYTNSYLENNIEQKIRNVKYRTSILTQPVENLLFNYKYSSSIEDKIIETAQNQWFINSYLNSHQYDDKSTASDEIKLREHFNTGVDYTTQTRDVILPRYVISEFGTTTMYLLLAIFILPVVLFFVGYRIGREKGILHAGGAVAGMSVLLLATLALFVWMTSTNRLVFFGQDFPFLSLTSKLSIALPMTIFLLLLTSKPEIRKTDHETIKNDFFRWLIFISLLLAVVFISGKSNIMDDERFKINFTSIETRLENINDVFRDIQGKKGNQKFSVGDFRMNPEKFINQLRHLFASLYSDKNFLKIYDEATVYERSIFDALKTNPKEGFDIKNPIHLKYDVTQELLSLSFNKYWLRELPAYNIRQVWQGNIVEQPFLKQEDKMVPLKYRITGQAEIIVIPRSYLQKGEGPIGLLNISGDVPDKDDSCYIFNTRSNKVFNYRPEYAVAKLGIDDIVIFSNQRTGLFKNWPMRENNLHYFAYNFLINSHQKHVYPLGSQFFWIRHWTAVNKSFYQTIKQYHTNSSISLDYNLNKWVKQYLDRTLFQYRNKHPELTFSVIAADGHGNIRLLQDYAIQREMLDPNDDYKVMQMENDHYFNIDADADRLQWGNQNLLQMPLGPGSSLKPLVAAAITSQLEAEWQDLVYLPGELGSYKDKRGQVKETIRNYAGITLPDNGWPTESKNYKTDFITYLSQSNNLYHSLLMFFGSYTKEDFFKNDGYSLKNILTNQRYRHPILQYPIMTFGNNSNAYYFPTTDKWPVTQKNITEGEKRTYFGSTTSLLANGLKLNFDLFVNSNTKYGRVESKSLFSTVVPESAIENGIWSSPESSEFYQLKRTAEDTIQNFNKGIRNPTLGADPYKITPVKMLEMYGKMTSGNINFRVSVDVPKFTVESWMSDKAWNSKAGYDSFLVSYIFKGMRNSLQNGTAMLLAGGQSFYNGYHLYAKTGTIGTGQNDNSKRLALIITKDPVFTTNRNQNRFYIVYFTIGKAYETEGDDKTWFWPIYERIVDEILSSASFKAYMNN